MTMCALSLLDFAPASGGEWYPARGDAFPASTFLRVLKIHRTPLLSYSL
jgi:hypothetical protein